MNSETTDVPNIMSFVVGPIQTNCYFVYDRQTKEGVVIDPGWHDEGMLRAVRGTGVKVICVINTHGHADHIAGNVDFAVPVIIHSLDEACLTDPSLNLSLFLGLPLKLPKAQRTVKDGDVVTVGNFALEVLHTPGHTRGGISLRCRNNVFSGDTLFFEGIGRTDLDGGDLKTILKSISEKLLPLPDEINVYPGHGPKTTIGEARRFMKKEFSLGS